MIYASRKATQKAIRSILNKPICKHNSTRNNSLCTSVDRSPLPKENNLSRISAKYFRNANGAELIYK